MTPLQELEAERAAIGAAIRRIVDATARNLAPDERHSLMEYLDEGLDDAYYPHIAPLREALDEAARAGHVRWCEQMKMRVK